MLKQIIHPTVGEVTLSRTHRSTRISLSIRPDGGVRLAFPIWVTQRRALRFLDEKLEWIASARQKVAARMQDRPLPPDKTTVEALRAQAKIALPQMVARLAAVHGFRYGAVRVKFTRTRWGSCTVRNDINLSLSLVALPEHLAEFVVLHELCHTVHKNHSARFHELLDRVTAGQSRALNRELRQYRPDRPVK